jgi:hypothetical protein
MVRKNYWFPKMRQTIKSILRNCNTCKLFRSKTYDRPPIPPLPYDIIVQAPAFTIIGIDYTGFLLVKEKKQLMKVYIILFTCAVTRAVSLEIVTDNSCDMFLLAFRRFVARRTAPSICYTDNSTTFIAASEHLAKLQNHPSCLQFLEHNKILWKFIPKRAPWFGGFWERLIGLTKNTSKRILGTAMVSLVEMQTIIAEVEMIINDRPLSYVSGELNIN